MNRATTVTAAAILAALTLGMTCQQGAAPGGRPAAAAAMLSYRFTRLEGGTVSAKELPFRLLVVCFFTTWADPGILQAKALSNLYQREAKRGLRVLGVVMDLEREASARPFVKQFAIAYPVALADETVARGDSPFGNISTVPASYVFDTDGDLLGVWTGVIPAKEMERLIERYLP